MENIEPVIDCENTDCDECGMNEWCNTYQDYIRADEDEDVDDNCPENCDGNCYSCNYR